MAASSIKRILMWWGNVPLETGRRYTHLDAFKNEIMSMPIKASRVWIPLDLYEELRKGPE